jgi:transposase InsO family protein
VEAIRQWDEGKNELEMVETKDSVMSYPDVDSLGGIITSRNGADDKEYEQMKEILYLVFRPEYSFNDLARSQYQIPRIQLALEIASETDLEEKKKLLPAVAKSQLLTEKEKKWIRRTYRDLVVTKEGVLVKKLSKVNQIILPPSYWIEVLHASHDLAGHLGETKTLQTVLSRFDWPGVRNDVIKYVRSCTRCQQGKGQHHIAKQKLKNIVTDRRNQLLQLDFETLSKAEYDGKTYIGLLVMIDHFTKYCVAVALTSFDAHSAALAVRQAWISRFGIPEMIQTDRGSQFESEYFQSFCRLSGISKIRSTAYHPESQGLVERQNQTLVRMLKVALSRRQLDWPSILDQVTAAYNCTMHASSGCTPNMLHMGHEAAAPIWWFFPRFSEEEAGKPVQEQVRRQLTVQAEMNELARHNLKRAQIRQKRNYDAKIRKLIQYAVGDYVMCFVNSI